MWTLLFLKHHAWLLSSVHTVPRVTGRAMLPSCSHSFISCICILIIQIYLSNTARKCPLAEIATCPLSHHRSPFSLVSILYILGGYSYLSSLTSPLSFLSDLHTVNPGRIYSYLPLSHHRSPFSLVSTL